MVWVWSAVDRFFAVCAATSEGEEEVHYLAECEGAYRSMLAGFSPPLQCRAGARLAAVDGA
jgi:hypothetical protein